MPKTKILKLAKELWPIHRTIAGPGIRTSLKIIKSYQNLLKIKSIKSGTKVFDWIVPNEWSIKNAWVKFNKKKIIDYKKNNLHVVGFSEKINKTVNLKNFLKRIHYLKNKPNAIPFVTSYYKKYWGFCIEYNKIRNLKKGKYHVYIDSNFKKGSLNYGEIFLKGKSTKEILFSTYLCHPSMANNEISGPCVSTFLSEYVKTIRNRYYSYRFIFIPETIGSIAYISKNLKKMKRNIIAGFNLSCIGDQRGYSYVSSRTGNTLADHVAKKVLNSIDKKFKIYSWLERGSDERQYCSPGVDLPICTLSRSKFGEFKEYHNSLDTIGNVVTQKGLQSSLEMVKKIVNYFEQNLYYKSVYKCEPFMTKRNLYNTISKYENSNNKSLMDIISFCDGKTELDDLAKLCNLPKSKLTLMLKTLEKNKLIYKTKI